MPATLNALAFDLGAESGRAMLGRFDGERLSLTEVHRFPNAPVRLPDGLHWDVLRLWGEIVTGIAKAVRESGGSLTSIGLDTWGVDFGLLDTQGRLLENPYFYRDDRTDGMLEEAFQRLPKAQIFEQTGIQFMQLNSLYQLLSMVVNRSPVLDLAATFLMMPDLFNYWLSGTTACEFSIATTSQCYDPRRRTWAHPLLEALDIPTGIFPGIVPPGTVLGPLLPSLEAETGAKGVSLVAPVCHDTGSAVAAVPAAGADFAWISSGTWSVLGAEVTEPYIAPQSLALNLTNEGGVDGTFRLCKNIMGLWLVQECRRTWAACGEVTTYGELAEMAAASEPFRTFVDPDHIDFLKPGDMPVRIQSFAAATGQPIPQTKGEIVRAALEGMALRYRLVLERIEALTSRHLDPIHIIGGGTQNRLLNQLTANATGRTVVTGPIEATALGNILVQLKAVGAISSIPEGRAVVRASTEVSVYSPQMQAGWDDAYARLLQWLG